MLDWLLWPADALLSAGGYVASWFTSKDTPGFLLLQMMMATLVLAAVVSSYIGNRLYWKFRS
jgi:hypothetical protein